MGIDRSSIDRNDHIVLGIDSHRLAIGAHGFITAVLAHSPEPAITGAAVCGGPHRRARFIDPASRQHVASWIDPLLLSQRCNGYGRAATDPTVTESGVCRQDVNDVGRSAAKSQPILMQPLASDRCFRELLIRHLAHRTSPASGRRRMHTPSRGGRHRSASLLSTTFQPLAGVDVGGAERQRH